MTKREEAFMQQKSRKNWLNMEDQNRAYFHSLVRIRQATNLMTCNITKAQGNSNPKAISIAFVDWAKTLIP
jgi:hypothetical protein